MNELISVIVPVYNVEKYLLRCVNSILTQTYHNLEIILVDDGSIDSSPVICDDICRHDSRIRVIHKENGGLSSARNAGLDNCNGSFVCFVDSDDYIESEMIETMYNSNIINHTLICCCGRFDAFENNKEKTIGLCPKQNEVIDDKEGIKRILTWNELDSSACDKMFSTSLWKNIRFPVGKISEDVAIMYLLFKNARKISLISRAFYNYFHRSNSITTSSFSNKSYHIIENVKDIETFILIEYPELHEDFLYFKVVEYCHVLSLMAKTKERHKQLEKELFIELKKCKKVFNRFSLKNRIRIFVLNNKFLFLVYRLIIIKK